MSSVNQITKALLENGPHSDLYTSLGCLLERIEQKIQKKSTFQTYIYSYPKILAHFSEFASDKHSLSYEEDLLVQGILMIYGWMPRIPRLDPEVKSSFKFKESIEFLSKFNHKSQGDFYSILLDKRNETYIKYLIQFVDNSLTAVSKILHFIRPEDFLIWDSKIRKTLGVSEFYRNNIEKYQEYISAFKSLRREYESKDRIKKILEEAKEIFQYRISFARLIELALYVSAEASSRKDS